MTDKPVGNVALPPSLLPRLWSTCWPPLPCLMGEAGGPHLPQAEWGNLGWLLLPWCILNTLPNSVHFAFDGEVAFWVFLSRDADLMDCDFSPDLLFKKKKSSIKKATQNFYLLRKKKICLLFRP